MTTESARSAVTRDEFLRNLADSGIPGAADALATARNAPADADGLGLAKSLIVAEAITIYQAAAILDRRFADLRMGNYEILDKLGAGGMGTVFKAAHRRMKRIVALKVLSKEIAGDANFVQRFQREVETIAQLSHPNIVMAFDADEADGGNFLVMEFVSGRDLSVEVAKNGPLAPDDAVGCLIQAARGLEYAHARGIVHRDIKPGNLLRDVNGVVKVADLGLARLAGPAGTGGPSSALTQAGGIVGTLDYMAPEQALDSTAIDQRVDIYSLGCTLHFLLTGRPPYESTTMMGLLLKHRDAPIPSLADAWPGLDPELDRIFRRMVAKAPADRYLILDEAIPEFEAVLPRLAGLAAPPRAPSAFGTGTNLGGTTVALPADKAFGGSETGAFTLAPSTIDAPPPSSCRAKGRTVILVEPSRTQAGIIRRFLEQLGVGAIHHTGSGREALALARSERAGVLVSSLHLADMTGLELARSLLADPHCAQTGFVLATSEADAEAAGELPPSSRLALMHKPFDLQRLTMALDRVCPAPHSIA